MYKNVKNIVLTSPTPINTLQTVRRYGLILAQIGVSSVSVDTSSIPIEMISRGPNLSANHPPGICRKV